MRRTSFVQHLALILAPFTHQAPVVSTRNGSFRIDRTERRTAYEDMMDALKEAGSSFEVDIPIKRDNDDNIAMIWYCRVFAQRHKDPVTGEPIIMVSHQDVTNLRKVAESPDICA